MKAKWLIVFVAPILVFGICFLKNKPILSIDQARFLAEKMSQRSKMKISMNESVYSDLLNLLSSSNEKDLEATMARMKIYKDIIIPRLQKRDWPIELLAVPMVGSAFKNTTTKTNGGIWHFCDFTARLYGLIVDGQIDERLDPVKSTNAALKLFSVYMDFFHDWQMAIVAYHLGSKRVLDEMDLLKTRDPWLVEKSLEPTYHNLSQVLASSIVIEFYPCLKPMAKSFDACVGSLL